MRSRAVFGREVFALGGIAEPFLCVTCYGNGRAKASEMAASPGSYEIARRGGNAIFIRTRESGGGGIGGQRPPYFT